jgi:hypothetical protein
LQISIVLSMTSKEFVPNAIRFKARTLYNKTLVNWANKFSMCTAPKCSMLLHHFFVNILAMVYSISSTLLVQICISYLKFHPNPNHVPFPQLIGHISSIPFCLTSLYSKNLEMQHAGDTLPRNTETLSVQNCLFKKFMIYKIWGNIDPPELTPKALIQNVHSQ